jgi:oligosaccharide repeat unit polymerase
LLLFSRGLREPDLVAPASQWQRVFGTAAMFIGACLAPVSIIHAQGYGVGEMFSLQTFTAVAIQTTADRYDLGVTQDNPILVAAGLANAFMWPTVTKKIWPCILLGLVPTAVYSVVTTAKWPFYCALSFFITAMLLRAPIGRNRSRALIQLGVVCLGGVAVSILAVATRERLSEVGDVVDGLGGMIFLLGHYLFAQYETFGAWLSQNVAYCCDFGRWSLAGPADYLGVAARAQGVFSENVMVQGLETNLYTAWRYGVQDFSILGLPLLILGIAALYRYALLARWSRASVFLRVMFLLSAFLQPVAPVGVYNSVLLAACICALWVREQEARSLAA